MCPWLPEYSFANDIILKVVRLSCLALMSLLQYPGASVEVWEWITNFIPHFTEHMIIYPYQYCDKGMDTWMRPQKQWGVITYPCFNSIGGLITSGNHRCNYLTVPFYDLTSVCEWYLFYFFTLKPSYLCILSAIAEQFCSAYWPFMPHSKR